MRLVAILLVVMLVAKDASHLGDRFVMRGLAQGLCLGAGALWVLLNLDRIAWRRYLLFGAYLGLLLLSAFSSDYAYECYLQIGSLFAVLVFSLAVVEGTHRETVNAAILETTFWAYFLVCVVSLALIRLAPALAYQIGDIAGWKRFAGLFGRPAMMSAAAGVLLAISLFHEFRQGWPMVVARTVAAAAALACLYLAGARTFWVGIAVAVPLTACMKYRQRAVLIGAVAAVAFAAYLIVQAFDLTMSEKTREEKFRVQSLPTLTGRTHIWEATFAAVAERPFLGFGFGMGGVAVSDRSDKSAYLIEERATHDLTAPTLHSGYVQALGDSGYLGAIVYAVIVVLACVRLAWPARAREHGAACCLALFLAVANFAESIIFKASVWHSILFWYLAVLGFAADRPRVAGATSAHRSAAQVPSILQIGKPRRLPEH